jgi:hypothetical protein
MKKMLLMCLATTLLLCGAAIAGQVTLKWDANNPTPKGYTLFERNATSPTYNYDAPIWPTDGQDHTETTATVTVSDNEKHAFVVRAYAEVTKLDGTKQTVWSGDSNEVTSEPASHVDEPKGLIIEAIQYLSRAIDNLAQAADLLK